MSKKLVTTINNEQIPISECRLYNKKYYKIGNIEVENSGDCYKIDDKFYRVETGQIVFNHTERKYCIKNGNLIYGLIEGNQRGYFTNNKDKIKVIDENGLSIYALNENILINNLAYRERMSSGEYFHISRVTARELNKIKIPNKDYKFSLPYDSKGITDKHLDIYNNLYDSKISGSINDFSKLLEDLTFGLEFETIAGFLPSRITNRLGLIPLRDGSIAGLEYVTVPFKGAKGMQTVVDIAKELEKRTAFDYKCSLHLHLGEIPRTPEFILAFFRLSLFIQDELFSMFPIYKKYNLGIKNKNYSKPYPSFKLVNKMNPVINASNIKENFAILFDYLVGEPGSFYHNYNNDLGVVQFHPKDSSGHQKWNISTRYYFHNFVPLIFGNKQTVEFRIHTPTYDLNKIFMFIGLNAVLVNFTKMYQKDILEKPNFFDSYPLGLENIVKKYITTLDQKGVFKGNTELSITTLYDSFRKYISTRKAKIEGLTASGHIVIDEDELQGIPQYIEWDGPRYIKSDFQKKEGNIRLDEEFPDLPPIEPQKVVKKKPLKKEVVSTSKFKTIRWIDPETGQAISEVIELEPQSKTNGWINHFYNEVNAWEDSANRALEKERQLEDEAKSIKIINDVEF